VYCMWASDRVAGALVRRLVRPDDERLRAPATSASHAGA
jgi:hypothetical protein